MRVRLTVLGAGGAPGDVEVQAPPGTTWSQVAAALGAGTPGAAARAHVDGSALAADAPLGAPPLVHGAVVVLGPPPAAAPPGRRGARTGPGVLRALVVGGPDSGRVLPLPPGEHALGRSVRCGLRLADPDVSRAHAVLRVGATGVEVTDSGSTNGTLLAGDPLPPGEPGTWPPGGALDAGSSTLELAVAEPEPALLRPDGAGHVEVNRPPRLVPAGEPARVVLPAPPRPRPVPPPPWVALLVPLLLGAVLAVVLSPLYALLVLLSPVLALGTWLGERRAARREGQQAAQEHAAATAAARQRVREAVLADVARRRDEAPDAARLLLAATGPGTRLWCRRPGDADALLLRVGTADLPARVLVEGPGAEPPVAEGVPLAVGLRAVGVLGACGPRERLDALARHLVGQLAVLHAPHDVRLVVLAAPGTEGSWRWARWLPHTGAAEGEPDLAEDVPGRVRALLELLDARRAARGPLGRPGAEALPAVVVVLDGASALRRVPGAARLLAEGPAVGVHALCLDTGAEALPAECGAVAALDPDGGPGVRLDVAGAAASRGVADLVGPRWAERVARALAPLRDAAPAAGGGALPGAVRLVDLLPVDACDADAVADLWAGGARTTAAVLGRTAEGPWVVDLAADGPHALVAGTTGSGKSELLQALVASLAVANRPDELTFVLVDYKGGSAFAACAGLPHTSGTVTDLDPAGTERALASLAAETVRRERLLAEHGARDLEAYRRVPGATPLPRLLIVVDEFATLAEELPDFLGGLVGVAQRGRSLGIHLVLATQRPGGVVSADIRANTSLRIALRTSDAGESQDVVERPDAAHLPRHRPGRAVVRSGAGEHLLVQAAQVSGRAPAEDAEEVRVRPLDGPGAAAGPASGTAASGSPASGSPASGTAAGPTDLERLVDACAGAARRLGLAPARGPWLPPLPDDLPLQALPSPSRRGLPFALSDLPGEQARRVEQVDLDDTRHWLVAGGPGSGRTGALLAVAAQAARLGPDAVHLYVLDGAGGPGAGTGLAGLAGLAGCGAVVGRDEPARAARLVARLLEEVARRRALPDAGAELPRVLLLVDGWEGLVGALEPLEHGRAVDDLLRLLREGPAAGLRAVVTGDRTSLTGRVAPLLTHRLLLRFADPGDVALAGVPPRLLPAVQPPGRGLLAAGAVLTQVARPPAAAPAQHQPASAGERAPRCAPLRVDPLPSHVTAAEALALGGAAGTGPWWALLGVGGDELAARGIDLAADGPAAVVAGPPGSGRSSALLAAATHLVAAGRRVLVVAPASSPLAPALSAALASGAATAPGPAPVLLAPHEEERLRGLLADASGDLALVVDDVEQLLGGPVDDLLCAALRPGGPARYALLGGDGAALAGAYRGLGVEARRSRSGVLLAPGGGLEADLLGVRVPRGDDRRPGRGVLVRRGRAEALQVALPAAPPDPTSAPASDPASEQGPRGACAVPSSLG